VIKLLVTNGCSLTRGLELEHPEEQAWPALVADHLDVRVINFARDGGSNRRLVRTTIERLDAVAVEQKVDSTEVLFLGLWTSLDRSEYFDPGLSIHRGRDSSQKAGTSWRPIGPWLMSFRNPAVKAFYRYLWSSDGQQASFLLDWVMFDVFLTTRGYNALYAFGYPYVKPRSFSGVFAENLIDRSRVFGQLSDALECSFLGLTWDLTRGPGLHPLADSHAIFADALYEWIASLSIEEQ